MTGYGTISAHARPVGHFLRLYGTRGTVHADFRLRTAVADAEQTVPSALGRLLPALRQGLDYLRAARANVWRFTKSDFHYFAGMRRLMTEFYRSIRDDLPPPIEYALILRTTELMDRIIVATNAAAAESRTA